MRDISMRTPNAQRYIKYDWAAWEAEDDKEFRRILDEREKFCDENFTLEDYDSMIEDSKSYPPACNMWKRAKERYISDHKVKNIQSTNNGITKAPNEQLKKAI